jgi:uncharacterized membrane protein
MLAGSIALAIAAVRLDIFLTDHPGYGIAWFGGMEAEAARKILATIAGTMITVAGVVFSITIVALQLASSQFGPRLLRNFMSDLGNQFVLGTFTAAFVYCLLVLATVRTATHDHAGFVPVAATAIGLLLGVVSIAVLIFFIHHTAGQIRIENVAARLAGEIDHALEELFPHELGEEPEGAREAAAPADFERSARVLASDADGYIRYLDDRALMSTAERHDLLIRLCCRPGGFIIRGMPLLAVWPAERVDDGVERALRASIVLGPDRTPLQDPRFALQQLTQVALRALSPALNDPFTAIECINRLGEGLRHASRRCRPSSCRFGADGSLRVLAPSEALGSLAIYALDPIAVAAQGSGVVSAAILHMVALIGDDARYDQDRSLLLGFARDLAEQAARHLERAQDRERVADAMAECRRRLAPAAERI